MIPFNGSLYLDLLLHLIWRHSNTTFDQAKNRIIKSTSHLNFIPYLYLNTSYISIYTVHMNVEKTTYALPLSIFTDTFCWRSFSSSWNKQRLQWILYDEWEMLHNSLVPLTADIRGTENLFTPGIHSIFLESPYHCNLIKESVPKSNLLLLIG